MYYCTRKIFVIEWYEKRPPGEQVKCLNCSFCLFFLLVFLSCYSYFPLKIQLTWFHLKHLYCTMQPGEWFLSGPVFVAEVIDRDLEAGIQEKVENWAKCGWLSVMTKSAIASILSKVKSYSKQKERLHAYQPRNLWIVLLMFYHLIIQVTKLKRKNIVRKATIYFLIKNAEMWLTVFFTIFAIPLFVSVLSLSLPEEWRWWQQVFPLWGA